MLTLVMSIGNKVQELGRFLEACERRRDVERVDLTEVPSSGSGVAADIELEFSTCPSDTGEMGISFVGTSVGDDGGIQLTFEPADPILERLDGVDLEFSDATFDSDGTVSVTLTASTTIADGTPTDDGQATDETTAVDRVATTSKLDDDVSGPVEQPGADGSTENADGRTGGAPDGLDRTETADEEHGSGAGDVPPFRNPELLRDIYVSCDTFDEMRDALPMDITAETVRRYMISHGIHEPSTYDTTAEDNSEVGSPETAEDPETELLEADDDVEMPDAIADGIGLPEDVSVEALIDTVQWANTLYEVQTEFGIDRDEALSMLRQTGLFHHVVGRLSKKEKREASREMVIESLRQQTSSG